MEIKAQHWGQAARAEAEFRRWRAESTGSLSELKPCVVDLSADGVTAKQFAWYPTNKDRAHLEHDRKEFPSLVDMVITCLPGQVVACQAPTAKEKGTVRARAALLLIRTGHHIGGDDDPPPPASLALAAPPKRTRQEGERQVARVVQIRTRPWASEPPAPARVA